MFCLYHGHADEPAIAFKVAKTEQSIFLEDPRFYRTPYIGQHGWVSLREQASLNWDEIEELAKGSYQLVAPRLSLKDDKPQTPTRKCGRDAGAGLGKRADRKSGK